MKTLLTVLVSGLLGSVIVETLAQKGKVKRIGAKEIKDGANALAGNTAQWLEAKKKQKEEQPQLHS